MTNHDQMFIKALESRDVNLLKLIPKADLHNHFFLGGNRAYIEKHLGINIPELSSKLHNMDEMHKWVNQNIGAIFDTADKRRLAIEATFVQACGDGVTILEIGDDVWANEQFYGGNLDKLIETFQTSHKQFAPETKFRFQIGLSRHCPIKMLEEWLDPFWGKECFYSVDLYGDEMAQPIINFKPLYRKAKARGLVLKAHVGEWGDADSVKEAVEELELDEVQHGIAASKSLAVMHWLADNHIQLNICPTSNVLLNRVESIEKHPIRTLFDQGIKVTVNTDDILVFGQSVSQEFINLFNARVFSAEELNVIRKYGLGVK